MANRAAKKSKKPLQTTLGKATGDNEKDVDLSHVQKPINTSVFGLRQVLSLFQTATKEVQNYITYECDIMYECRTCRTIFRSLANFILHKRDYCRERFNPLVLLNNDKEVQENTCLENTQNIFCVESRTLPSDKNLSSNLGMKKSLSPVIERLKEKQEICQLAQEVLNQDLSSKEVEAKESNQLLNTETKNDDLLLEEIATNNAAVFQTVLRNLPKRDINKPKFMKSEVMEIHGILDSDEAVLGPDGKICTFETNKVNQNPIIPKNNLFCTECNLKFATKKTLTYHIKYKHNNTRLVYVCPDCKDSFANAWCVYRHLFKIHRRTSAQIKRMREQIHNSCIRKDQEPIKKKDKKNCEKMDKTDEENQWLNNIEGDNDFQMCGGCGKRFERKAALHSHAQMCTKRIAICNTIKENNAKKKEEEISKDFKIKNAKAEKVGVLKGSSKRKPYLLRTYKSSEEESRDNSEVLPTKGNDVCDLNANCEIVETNCDNSKDIEEEEVIRKPRNSLSSSEDLSPSKNQDVVSPSIEKIDTEKMLHIIGISANYENNMKENDCNPKCPDNDRSLNEKDFSKESSRSHTASDFDLFCQNVAESLLTDPLGGIPEVEDCTQKVSRTIPLILRRRKSSKSEKNNSILEINSETASHGVVLNENKTETGLRDPVGNENIAQINDSVELDSSPSSSNFKISVKSLEDLIGVSPQDHIKNSESNDTNLNTNSKEQIISNESDHLPTTFTANEISDTVRANVSPENLQEIYPKYLKRKRTSSFDLTECKFSKVSKGTVLPDKQDISFISRASPFMDQNKLLCIPCQTIYPTLSKLLWHMSAHFSWFRFQCSRCSFISFNKLDCANHARKTHFVKKESIQSVVLPIPNWKTVLMSHDFCMLNDENDLSGKHTDEVFSGDPEETDDIEDVDEKMKDNECDESEWTIRLFVESRDIDSESENDPLECDMPLDYADSIKQENIDVINDAHESFQIEVPQEIYTLDVSEIIEGANYEERCRYGTQIKLERVDDEEDTNMSSMSTYHENDEPFIDTIKIKAEITSDEEANEKVYEKSDIPNNFEDQEFLKKQSDQSVKTRPTRNRTKSIKTIQDDFFYDLSKVIKLNDTSVNKSNLQKHKRSVNSVSQKITKDSVSSNAKSETQKIRVYSKRK